MATRAIRRRFLNWRTLGAAVLLLLILAYIASRWLAHRWGPGLREAAIEMLEDRFHSDVDLKSFDVSVWPSVRIHGTGLVLRHEGRTDVPPLFSIEEFWADAPIRGMLKRPWRIRRIRLRGMTITIPPKKDDGQPRMNWKQTKNFPVFVERIDCNDAVMIMLPNKAGRPPHEYDIHSLVMLRVGLNQAADFTARLTIDTPPGDIDTGGKFGPWNADEPGDIPLAAKYTFDRADLGKFKGISGILSSTGEYSGALEELDVKGETRTPDFVVTVGGHPVSLSTDYEATVDGTNGNTYLHPVNAKFLNTLIVANGMVVKTPDNKGREILLDVVIDKGRIEDLLRLVVKADKPLMTGSVRLNTKFDLNPGDADIVERLKLNGRFGVGAAKFTNPEVREKLEGLSRRGQGHPGDEDAGSSISNLKGHFALGGGIITFQELTFSVPGASVQLAGTYGLKTEELDFHGKLLLQAKLSQTQTGIKSFMLKPFDPFFRKGDVTQLPIKVTGTRDKPSFGLDLGH
jgi:hypothetical protein